ncbi:MAG: hypothetical protein IPJ01_11620 [Micavibrio sp.]|nr:hypothetical protein [Micavibrio sp.]
MENLKNEIKIRLVMDNFGILVRNDMDLVCPFVPPMPFRQQKQTTLLGGQSQEEIMMQKSACNTGCPLMQINDKDTIEVCCGGAKVTHKIAEVITVEKQMEKKKDNILNLKIEKKGDTNVN